MSAVFDRHDDVKNWQEIHITGPIQVHLGHAERDRLDRVLCARRVVPRPNHRQHFGPTESGNPWL